MRVSRLNLEAGVVDLSRREVTRDGKILRLSELEVQLLRYFASKAGQPIPRSDILRDIWGYRSGVVTRAVDDAVKRLRGKIEPRDGPPRHIHTVRGVGYRFELDTPQQPKKSKPSLGLIGRSSVLEQLSHALQRHPLVTLVGPAGVGKTSLAREQALQQGGTFVDLSDAVSPADTIRLICGALGLKPADAGSAAIEHLEKALRALGDKLLILDNFEQIIDQATQLEAWQRAAPQLRVLVTSREHLRLRGEQVVRVSPLPPPDAMLLFMERAKRADQFFNLDDSGDASLVEAIVRELDGLPLAIELAAARIMVLPLPVLLDRLKNRFAVLAGGWRGASPRQASLEGALRWSLELLSKPEREAFFACALFRGGFRFAAAEEVIARPDALELVCALVDKSLFQPAGDDGRLRLLESVRAFAIQQAGDQTEALHRLARWAAGLDRWAITTHAEIDNLFAGIDAALRVGDPDLAMEVYVPLDAILGRVCAPYASLFTCCARILAAPGLSPLHRIRLRNGLAGLQMRDGDLDAAWETLNTALTEAREIECDRWEALTLRVIATNAIRRGDIETARPALNRALILLEGGRPRQLAAIQNGYGNLLNDTGDPRAEEMYRQAAANFRKAGDRSREGIVYGNLGNLFLALDQLDRASSHYTRAIALLTDAPDAVFRIYIGRAKVQISRNDLAGALQLIQTGIDQTQTLGVPPGRCSLLTIRAHIQALQGRADESLACAWEAYDLTLRQADRRLEMNVRFVLTLCLQRAGRLDQAREALARALPLAVLLQQPLTQARLHVLAARIALESGQPSTAQASLELASRLPERLQRRPLNAEITELSVQVEAALGDG